MGTTFVTLTRKSSGEDPGFWINDGLLELWLRLLSLHLPEPDDFGEHSATPEIRNRWLFASRGYFTGCVPHDMEFACATPEGQAVAREAINSLLKALNGNHSPLDPETLNLLGIEGTWCGPIDRQCLKDIANAFLDLMDGKITGTARSTDLMPGSKPYVRSG